MCITILLVLIKILIHQSNMLKIDCTMILDTLLTIIKFKAKRMENETPFMESLTQTVKWYLDNPKWLNL